MSIEKKLMGKNLINLDRDDLDRPVYRIFSFRRFVELLKNKENVLVRPALWEDPFENFFLKSKAVTSEGEHVSLESLERSWYGQCWTLNRDSDAMWRIYSHDKYGIRVKTTIRKLLESIYDGEDEFSPLKYFIGKVSYGTKDKIDELLKSSTFTDMACGGQSGGFCQTLLVKREEFSHENEIRLLFNDVNDKFKGKDFVTFPFQCTDLLDEVALDPRLSDFEFECLKAGLVSSGCDINIIKSDLYKFTPAVICL